jgi:hypothetical protein
MECDEAATACHLVREQVLTFGPYGGDD